VFRKGEPVEAQAVSYCAARKQLLRERKLLGLGGVSWHSKKGLSRSVIMRAGGWRSSAVVTYIRVEDAGVQMGDAVL
jgi:hypothetical protein